MGSAEDNEDAASTDSRNLSTVFQLWDLLYPEKETEKETEKGREVPIVCELWDVRSKQIVDEGREEGREGREERSELMRRGSRASLTWWCMSRVEVVGGR